MTTSFPNIGTYALLNQGDFTFSSTKLDSLYLSTKPVLNIDNIFPQDIMLFRTLSDEIRLLDHFQLRNSLYLESAVQLEDINDYDQDGFDDYCYTRCWFGYCTDSVYIRINDQDWGFQDSQDYYVDPMWTMFFVRSTDLNGDTYPDLVLSGYNDRRQFKILWNDGDGTFSYLNPVGIKEIRHGKTSLTIFPNPANHHIDINMEINHEDTYEIMLYSLTGQKLFQSIGKFSIPGTYSIRQDVSTIPSGIYFLVFQSNGAILDSKKLVKSNE